MKVYVDELPKDCLDCPCYNGEYIKCKLIHCEHSVGYFNENELDYKNVPINQDFEELNCPLQSLSDHTKQVRKEVCEQVKDYMENHSYTIPVDTKNRKVVYKIGLTRFLDQIQGE